ncbi:hypothetical protein V1503_19265 [Bacillus sp. SCS-151]|uniref:hypothetical protein n=1 Tax=Nanhaiella sioensis TaxID=3115293 RepID=UPI00397A1672
MKHYDYLDEDVLRDDITERIKGLNNAIEQYKEKERLLEEDLLSVTHEISRELLRSESDKMVRWTQSYQQEVFRLKKLLSRHDEGLKIPRYEFGLFGSR